MFVNETTNETTTIDTPHSDFYLFTINAGGRVRNRLKLSSTIEGTGMWQIPAVGTPLYHPVSCVCVCGGACACAVVRVRCC